MPGLRENLMERLSREIVIDSEFAALIPPLTDDEFNRLEQSIIAEGCRDALVLWGNILIDGHNRYKICKKHNIEFRTIQREIKDRDDVLVWIMQNQLSRRNLSDFQRVELVRKCEEAVKAQAKARQGTRTDILTCGKNCPQVEKDILTCGKNCPQVEKEKQRATSELGAMAGVSRKTYEHATAVLDQAPEPVIEATRRKELSINAAYGVTKLPESQQAEIAERIVRGEKAKSVIAEIRAHEEPQQEEHEEKQPEAKLLFKDEREENRLAVSSAPKMLHEEKYVILNISVSGRDKEINRQNLITIFGRYGMPMFRKYTGVLFIWIDVEQLEAVMNPSIFDVCNFKYQGIVYVLKSEDRITGLCLLATLGDAETVEAKALLKEATSYEADEERTKAIKELIGTGKTVTTLTLDENMKLQYIKEL